MTQEKCECGVYILSGEKHRHSSIPSLEVWKKYPRHAILYEGCDCFWQKLIDKNSDTYADIVQWTTNDTQSYSLKIQIHQDKSITGMTINVDNFSYKELNFDAIEIHAKKIIKALT